MKVDEVFVDNDNMVVGKGLDVNKQCDKGQTPSHYACQGGNTQLVKDLLGWGADVHIEDHDGSTALQTACKHGSLSTVSELIHAGSDFHTTDTQGRTALQLAQHFSHSDIVQGIHTKYCITADECKLKNTSRRLTL